jgi:hypothetical protein
MSPQVKIYGSVPATRHPFLIDGLDSTNFPNQQLILLPTQKGFAFGGGIQQIWRWDSHLYTFLNKHHILFVISINVINLFLVFNDKILIYF